MLFCGKNHTLPKNNQEYFVESCTECNKWCYTNNKCKGDSVDSLCVDCKKKSLDNATSDKVSPMYSISPITTQFDPSKRLLAHNHISSLLDGFVINQECDCESYMTHFKRKLTHLDLKLHNIFSLNLMNTEPVNGLFLSSHSVMTLLQPETTLRVTEELFNFFVDCFNFYGEYLPVPKESVKTSLTLSFVKPMMKLISMHYTRN